jgi:hypothetical protein
LFFYAATLILFLLHPDVTLTLKMVFYENGFKVDSFNNPIMALKNMITSNKKEVCYR